jgi:TatD DNase family protein
MRWIDTHCHLDFPQYETDREEVVRRALASGVVAMINVASSLDNSRRAIALAQAYPSVWATVGIHPHDAVSYESAVDAEIASMARHPRVVAIGEVGLDYYRNLSPADKQRDLFRFFIDLAIKESKPLIIHSRDADDDLWGILQEFDLSKIPGIVIHCFSSGLSFLKRCLEQGFFVSFTGNITYKKAHGLREVVRATPLDRMMLETDAPFLSPEGRRGQRNEPVYVVDVGVQVSHVLGVDREHVASVTTQNACRFFGIGDGYE